jgi:hypothetical protein
MAFLLDHCMFGPLMRLHVAISMSAGDSHSWDPTIYATALLGESCCLPFSLVVGGTPLPPAAAP